jgi:hypothetical protein
LCHGGYSLIERAVSQCASSTLRHIWFECQMVGPLLECGGSAPLEVKAFDFAPSEFKALDLRHRKVVKKSVEASQTKRLSRILRHRKSKLLMFGIGRSRNQSNQAFIKDFAPSEVKALDFAPLKDQAMMNCAIGSELMTFVRFFAIELFNDFATPGRHRRS